MSGMQRADRTMGVGRAAKAISATPFRAMPVVTARSSPALAVGFWINPGDRRQTPGSESRVAANPIAASRRKQIAAATDRRDRVPATGERQRDRGDQRESGELDDQLHRFTHAELGGLPRRVDHHETAAVTAPTQRGTHRRRPGESTTRRAVAQRGWKARRTRSGSPPRSPAPCGRSATEKIAEREEAVHARQRPELGPAQQREDQRSHDRRRHSTTSLQGRRCIRGLQRRSSSRRRCSPRGTWRTWAWGGYVRRRRNRRCRVCAVQSTGQRRLAGNNDEQRSSVTLTPRSRPPVGRAGPIVAHGAKDGFGRIGSQRAQV